MGCGYHHSGSGALEAYCVTELRRRPDVVKDINVYSVCGHDVGSYPREELAVVAAVVGDAYLQLTLAVFEHIVCEALGSHSYGVLVHPVGSDAHYAAEAASTEFEIAVEGILEAHRVIVPEFEDFALGFRVEISVQPALGDFFVRFSHECKNNLVLYMLSVCDY